MFVAVPGRVVRLGSTTSQVSDGATRSDAPSGLRLSARTLDVFGVSPDETWIVDGPPSHLSSTITIARAMSIVRDTPDYITDEAYLDIWRAAATPRSTP